MSLETLQIYHWNPLKQNSIIVGADQSGKTNLGKVLTTILHPKYNVVILDFHKKFTNLDINAVIRNVFDIKGIGLQILQPYEMTEELFDDICGAVYKLRNVVFMVDELHNWTKKQWMPDNLKLLVRNC